MVLVFASSIPVHVQVPDWVNARINGQPARDLINDTEWFENEFTPKVATRGGALIKKWGRSSAASTAVSIADAVRMCINCFGDTCLIWQRAR